MSPLTAAPVAALYLHTTSNYWVHASNAY